MKTYNVISIKEINPYDDTHPPTKEGWNEVDQKYKDNFKQCFEYHREGINFIKKGIIEDNKQINPIAVRERKVDYYGMMKKYERLDGFKRFMALKEMGIKEIPCYVYEGDEGTPGCQYNENCFLEE